MADEKKLYNDALEYMEQRKNEGDSTISIEMIQRKFQIGYSPVYRLMDRLEAEGRVGRYNGSKPREIL